LVLRGRYLADDVDIDPTGSFANMAAIAASHLVPGKGDQFLERVKGIEPSS
jgi:hypothetical protein